MGREQSSTSPGEDLRECPELEESHEWIGEFPSRLASKSMVICVTTGSTCWLMAEPRSLTYGRPSVGIPMYPGKSGGTARGSGSAMSTASRMRALDRHP